MPEVGIADFRFNYHCIKIKKYVLGKVENKMKKRIINYRLKIDNLLANPDKISKEEWKKILQEHLTQIGFFQHGAWARRMRHGRRIKAVVSKSHNRHMQFVQTLSSVVHAGKGRKPRCAGFVLLATTVQFSYFLSFFCAVESISLIRFSWFTSEAPGS